MISKNLVRLAGGFALLAAILPGGIAVAQSNPGLSPLLQVESTGITRSHFDIHLCDICDFTKQLLVARQMTIFTDRSVVGVTSTNDLDDPAGTTSTVVDGEGSQEAFARLAAALAAAREHAGLLGCSVSFHETPPPPRPDSIVTETVNHDYILTWYDSGNTLHTFVIDSTRPACPAALHQLVFQTLQYFKSVAPRETIGFITHLAG